MSPEVLIGRRALGTGAVGAVIAAVVAGGLLSGCDAHDDLSLPGTPEGPEEPDAPRVQEALSGERAMLEQVQQVRRRHRELRRLLAPAAEGHRAHVALLQAGNGDETESAGPASSDPVPDDPRAAVARLARRELALAEQHVATALRSRSGVLARAVASMSAAAAQQGAVLPTLLPDPARHATGGAG